MCKYAMINFYCESITASDSTIVHHQDILPRVFDQMQSFGIMMQDEIISGLTGANLQRWFNQFRKDKKPATINNYVVTLNPFLRWAHVIYPEIPDVSNVLHCVKMPDYDHIPDEEKPKEKYYSTEEINELLAIPKYDSPLKKRDRAIIALFVGSGLRVSELCQLTIGSILDYKHGYVRVRRKGGAFKDVDVAEFCYGFIKTYLATRDDADDHSRPLFTTIHGEPCNRKQIYSSMSTRQKKLGIGDNRQTGCHVFRHKFVSDIEKIGGSAVARDCANHKSIAITNRYDHSTAEQRHDAVNRLAFGA